jgi:hypothetical protein
VSLQFNNSSQHHLPEYSDSNSSHQEIYNAIIQAGANDVPSKPSQDRIASFQSFVRAASKIQLDFTSW